MSNDPQPGDRVLLHDQDGTDLGLGTYQGTWPRFAVVLSRPLPAEQKQEAEIPVFTLDSGDHVFGFECTWTLLPAEAEVTIHLPVEQQATESV